MPAVPLVSLVSVAVPVRCFGDHSACSAYGVLGVCFHSVIMLDQLFRLDKMY